MTRDEILDLAAAHRIITATGYHRRDADLAELTLLLDPATPT